MSTTVLTLLLLLKAASNAVLGEQQGGIECSYPGTKAPPDIRAQRAQRKSQRSLSERRCRGTYALFTLKSLGVRLTK
jgi:hypothetical protein